MMNEIFTIYRYKFGNREPLSPPPLSTNQVHLWQMPLPTDDNKSSLDLCKPLLLSYLGEHHKIERNENGKPMALNADNTPSSIQFNISHTKDALFIAFVCHYDIGIDIESFGAARPWQSLMKRFYAAAEIAQIEQSKETLQRDLFFKIWTLKEAMIKCLGLSLFTGLNLAQFNATHEPISLLHPLENGTPMTFFHLVDSHFISIALRPRSAQRPSSPLFLKKI